jgi:hypothetical protein
MARLYREDDVTVEMETGYEYVLVEDGVCYAAELLAIQLPSWTHAKIRRHQAIPVPHPGLVDGSVTALDGWHYLVEDAGIEEIVHA